MSTSSVTTQHENSIEAYITEELGFPLSSNFSRYPTPDLPEFPSQLAGTCISLPFENSSFVITPQTIVLEEKELEGRQRLRNSRAAVSEKRMHPSR